MWHPSEDDLILHAYGEEDGAGEERVTRHLEACSACRAEWDELSATLKLVDAAAIPEPADGFEAITWARLQPALPGRRAPWWSSPVVAWTAVAAVLMIGVGFGVQRWTQRPRPEATLASSPQPARDASSSRLRERVLLTALDEHFEQAQTLLVELMNAPQAGDAEVAFERSTAGDLVASGRLYRLTAEQNGDLQFAQMLADLESVLVDISQSPSRVDRKTLASLRARIDRGELLFKVRAITNEVHRRQKTLTDANN